MRITEGQRAAIDLILRDPHGCPRDGLGAEDVAVAVKRSGETEWNPKALGPTSWQDAGAGTYVLTLDPAEVECPGIAVLVKGAPSLEDPIEPVLRAFEVEEAARRRGAGSIPRTILSGHVVTLDQRGKAKQAVIARVAQLPLLVGGIGVSNEQITAETDEDGYFELSVVTGAVIHVQVPALGYAKQLVVPPPPAPGIPVRLFSL